MKRFFYVLLGLAVMMNASCFRSGNFGKVTSESGDATIYSQKANEWKPLKKSQSVSYGDTILSKSKPVEVTFMNKSTIKLEPNTKIVVIDSSDKKNHYIFPIVFYGGVVSELKHKKPDDFTYIVYTPVAYTQPSGTHFYVSHTLPTNVTNVHSYDGNVIVYNMNNFEEPVEIGPGYTTVVTISSTPVKPRKLRYDQFRRIGYLIEPEVCKHYCVVWGFPVVPIIVPVPGVVPVPIVEEQVYVDNSKDYSRRDYDNNNYHEHSTRSRVNVNVNIDANGMGLPMPGLPVPFVPVAPVPAPRHVPRAHVIAPAPVVPPPMIAPVPVPVPGRPHYSNNNGNNRHIGGRPPLPPPPVPVPGHLPNPFRH